MHYTVEEDESGRPGPKFLLHLLHIRIGRLRNNGRSGVPGGVFWGEVFETGAESRRRNRISSERTANFAGQSRNFFSEPPIGSGRRIFVKPLRFHNRAERKIALTVDAFKRLQWRNQFTNAPFTDRFDSRKRQLLNSATVTHVLTKPSAPKDHNLQPF
ncbi:hypothetical protein GWI33_015291 [Rhynchophorus ferrugineus]|uniref:Uncharacterized protein n=1 Tax=Rhynchophorus ferrugineus TaxID=354439 RepID=A0A834IDJ6_RHYFE|nr:hypothetical protein GWI33_015291 [Rhynchophorus ferrugineus]